MSYEPRPPGSGNTFTTVCVSFFIGALALNIGVQLLDQVWVELVIGLAVVLALVIAGLVYRWRRDRW